MSNIHQNYLRQGSTFAFGGLTYTLYQVTGKLKATARGLANDLVWESRKDFERATGLLILPGRVAEMPAYEPQEWDDARLRKAVNYTEADIYAGVADDLKRAALAKLNVIEHLIPDAPSREARDEYSRHKAHITGTMARYAAALHNHAAGRENFTAERVAGDLADLCEYLSLPPGHDRIYAVYHVDPEMSGDEMRAFALSFPAEVEIEAVLRKKMTDHEYVGGSRQLPPKKLAQAVVFYQQARQYQHEVLARELAEYQRLRAEGPDAIGDEEAEKWGGRRDVCLEAALRSKRSAIAGAKGDIDRLALKVEEIEEAKKGRTVKAKAVGADAAQPALF